MRRTSNCTWREAWRRARLLVLAALLAGLIGQRGALGAFAATWKPAGLSGVTTYQLAVDPSGPGIVYAATTGGSSRAGLAKSVDGGRSWVPLERGLPLGFQPATLAVSPDDGRIVLAAGVEGLFRSTSAGTSWSAVRVPLPPLTAMVFNRADARMVLAGSELRGNFLSAIELVIPPPAHGTQGYGRRLIFDNAMQRLGQQLWIRLFPHQAGPAHRRRDGGRPIGNDGQLHGHCLN